MKKICIITEAGKTIGLGHLTRCLSLFQAFKEKGFLPEFFVHSNESLDSFLEGVEARVEPWFDKKEELLKEIKGSEVIVVDSYILEQDFYEQVRRSAILGIYIDDNMRLEYPAGIVVNGSIYAEEFVYPQKEGVGYLLGTRYTPIRKAFWDQEDIEIAEVVNSLLIIFGGSDLRGVSVKIAEAILKEYPGFKVKVIFGSKSGNSGSDKIDFIYETSASNVRKAFEESDIVISAAGQTLYELASLGIPTVAVLVAENQRNNVAGFQEAGFIEYAGSWEDKDNIDNVLKCVKSIITYQQRFRRQTIARSLIDGQGARRVVEFVCNYLERCVIKES